MLFEKKEHLVSGHLNSKTKEKIRLKLRLLLNRYSKCVIGISNQPDDRLRFRTDRDGYKAVFYVYKSSNLKNTKHYTETFQDLYINEIDKNDEGLNNSVDEDKKGPYFLFIAGRKSKRGY